MCHSSKNQRCLGHLSWVGYPPLSRYSVELFFEALIGIFTFSTSFACALVIACSIHPINHFVMSYLVGSHYCHPIAFTFINMCSLQLIKSYLPLLCSRHHQPILSLNSRLIWLILSSFWIHFHLYHHCQLHFLSTGSSPPLLAQFHQCLYTNRHSFAWLFTSNQLQKCMVYRLIMRRNLNL
jgi:hypothetical protein